MLLDNTRVVHTTVYATDLMLLDNTRVVHTTVYATGSVQTSLIANNRKSMYTVMRLKSSSFTAIFSSRLLLAGKAVEIHTRGEGP